MDFDELRVEENINTRKFKSLSIHDRIIVHVRCVAEKKYLTTYRQTPQYYIVVIGYVRTRNRRGRLGTV